MTVTPHSRPVGLVPAGRCASPGPLNDSPGWFNGPIDPSDHLDEDADVDPERLAVCGYWRCEELFEQKTSNQRYCRKACRSRQNRWQRAQDRRAGRG